MLRSAQSLLKPACSFYVICVKFVDEKSVTFLHVIKVTFSGFAVYLASKPYAFPAKLYHSGACQLSSGYFPLKSISKIV